MSNVAPVTDKTSKIVYSEDEIRHIPLGDIMADYDWNSRSKANVESTQTATSESQEGTGLSGLIAGIVHDGQDDPVIVRRVENHKTLGGKSTDRPFELLAGFRRYEAFTRLNADVAIHKYKKDEGKAQWVPNTANGTIRAVVKECTPAQARSVNMRENTNRSDLTTPDLVFGVRELLFTHKMSGVQVATELGISQSYTVKLGKIAGVNRKILEHWRIGGEFEGIPSAKALTVDQMAEISILDPSRQIDAYKVMIVGRNEKKDDNQRIEACAKRAATLANMLGKLAKLGFLNLAKNADWNDPDVVALFTKHGKAGLNKRQSTKCMKSAADAYVTAFEAEEEEEGEDTN